MFLKKTKREGKFLILFSTQMFNRSTNVALAGNMILTKEIQEQWQIEPTTRYTDMTKKQPISKRQMIQNKHDECKGVNTYTALVMSKFCEDLLE